jgi:hypothetical protein
MQLDICYASLSQPQPPQSPGVDLRLEQIFQIQYLITLSLSTSRFLSQVPLQLSKSLKSLMSLMSQVPHVPTPKPFSAKIEEPGGVFFLVPINATADAIVLDNVNSGQVRTNPEDPLKSMSLIGPDIAPKVPGRLVRFGRLDSLSSVVLNADDYPLEDQYQFKILTETGELMPHNLSEHQFTELWQGPNYSPMWLDANTVRSCVVPLDRESYFVMGTAAFRLIPRPTTTQQELDAFRDKRIAYAKQSIPEESQEPI